MKEQKQNNPFSEVEETVPSVLILHNDDENTFDFVIDVLIDVCEHDELQAEQCALITHHKGKCDIKKGEFTLLSHMKDLLLEKGLSATINS